MAHIDLKKIELKTKLINKRMNKNEKAILHHNHVKYNEHGETMDS